MSNKTMTTRPERGRRMVDTAASSDPLVDRLFAEFGTSEVPLADMCSKYLGLAEKEAKVKASMHQLPFPAYRVGNSRKNPWLVNIDQLAKHLRKVQADAEKEHGQCQA